MDEIDAADLAGELNFDPEIAFIITAGPGKWIACRTIDEVVDGRYCLWHIPGGSLPLFRGPGRPSGTISDPWSGWTEVKGGADASVPYFGGSHPAIIWWNVRIRSPKVPGGIGLTSFEWIGNHFRLLGLAADPKTEAWWARLRKRVRRRGARRIPRTGSLDGPKAEIWALPSALAKTMSGVHRDENPW